MSGPFSLGLQGARAQHPVQLSLSVRPAVDTHPLMSSSLSLAIARLSKGWLACSCCSEETAPKNMQENWKGKQKLAVDSEDNACSLKAPAEALGMGSGAAAVFDGDDSWTPLSTELSRMRASSDVCSPSQDLCEWWSTVTFPGATTTSTRTGKGKESLQAKGVTSCLPPLLTPHLPCPYRLKPISHPHPGPAALLKGSFSVIDLPVLRESPHAPPHPVLSFQPQHLPEMSPMPEAATIAEDVRQAGEKVPFYRCDSSSF